MYMSTSQADKIKKECLYSNCTIINNKIYWMRITAPKKSYIEVFPFTVQLVKYEHALCVW